MKTGKKSGVYSRADSPYWYVWWRDEAWRRKAEATPFRRDDQDGRMRARAYAREKEVEQLDRELIGGRDRWDRWVDSWLSVNYSDPARAGTLTRMRFSWKKWREFLDVWKIHTPRALTYQHVVDYINWRMKQPNPRNPKGGVSKNAALLDVRIMGIILSEAKRRGFCGAVVAHKIGIRKDAARRGRCATGDELAKMREAIRTRPQWMQVAFEILLCHGQRSQSVSMPWSRVDFANNTITFISKGKTNTVLMVPTVRALLLKVKESGSDKTCDLPKWAGKMWHYFFKEVGIEKFWTHCLRYTCVTHLAKSGVNMQQCMRFIGHSFSMIHMIYTDLGIADIDDAVAAASKLGDSSIATIGCGSNDKPPTDLSKLTREELMTELARRMA